MLGSNISDHKYIKVFNLQYAVIFQQFILEDFFKSVTTENSKHSRQLRIQHNPPKITLFQFQMSNLKQLAIGQTSSMAFQLMYLMVYLHA